MKDITQKRIDELENKFNNGEINMEKLIKECDKIIEECSKQLNSENRKDNKTGEY